MGMLEIKENHEQLSVFSLAVAIMSVSFGCGGTSRRVWEAQVEGEFESLPKNEKRVLGESLTDKKLKDCDKSQLLF